MGRLYSLEFETWDRAAGSAVGEESEDGSGGNWDCGLVGGICAMVFGYDAGMLGWFMIHVADTQTGTEKTLLSNQNDCLYSHGQTKPSSITSRKQ